MAEIGGIRCGCRGVSGGTFFHPGGFSCFLEQRATRNRNFFRNVSYVPSFKRGRLITKRSSVAGNSRIFRYRHFLDKTNISFLSWNQFRGEIESLGLLLIEHYTQHGCSGEIKIVCVGVIKAQESPCLRDDAH